MVKVVWLPNKKIDEIAGYKKVYRNSWIKGIAEIDLKNHKTNTIYLNTKLRTLKHPNFYTVETLFHELFHIINRFHKIDVWFDRFGRIMDRYIFARNYKGERIRK